jgi:hypothetical protein
MPKRTQLTEAEREQRRAADRAFVQQAVEALRSSDGWQRWLTTRRHFHSYSLLISGRPRQRRRVAGHGRWRHVADEGVAAAVRPFRGPRAVRPRLLPLPSMRKPLKKAFAEVRDLRPVSDDGCDSVSQRQPFAVEVLYERRQRLRASRP